MKTLEMSYENISEDAKINHFFYEFVDALLLENNPELYNKLELSEELTDYLYDHCVGMMERVTEMTIPRVAAISRVMDDKRLELNN